MLFIRIVGIHASHIKHGQYQRRQPKNSKQRDHQQWGRRIVHIAIKLRHLVIPAQAGIHPRLGLGAIGKMDPRLRGLSDPLVFFEQNKIYHFLANSCSMRVGKFS